MDEQQRRSAGRLLSRLGAGILIWLVVVGTGRAMAPLNNEHRQEAVQQIYANYKKIFPEVPEVTPAEAIRLQQAGQAVLVDVRPEVERRISRLPGAISAAQFLTEPERFRGRSVIAYDTVGYRSGLFVQKLQPEGIHLANLAGGLLGWLHAGGRIYDDHGETRRVHIYGSMWNYAPSNYEVVR